jgi:hypothetical protein
MIPSYLMLLSPWFDGQPILTGTGEIVVVVIPPTDYVRRTSDTDSTLRRTSESASVIRRASDSSAVIRRY